MKIISTCSSCSNLANPSLTGHLAACKINDNYVAFTFIIPPLQGFVEYKLSQLVKLYTSILVNCSELYSNMTFSEDYKLAESLRKYPVIYDKGKSSHKDVVARGNAWNKVACRFQDSEMFTRKFEKKVRQAP